MPPCVIVKFFHPPSAMRLAKEIKSLQVAPKDIIHHKINATLPLRDHPINVLIRKSNDFIVETFLKPNDQ